MLSECCIFYVTRHTILRIPMNMRFGKREEIEKKGTAYRPVREEDRGDGITLNIRVFMFARARRPVHILQ